MYEGAATDVVFSEEKRYERVNEVLKTYAKLEKSVYLFKKLKQPTVCRYQHSNK